MHDKSNVQPVSCRKGGRYTLKVIARELSETALGNEYHGNALYVAQDIPGLSEEERAVIKRWLSRVEWRRDWRELLAVAHKVSAMEGSG